MSKVINGRDLLNSSPVAVLICDHGGKAIYRNQRYEDAFFAAVECPRRAAATSADSDPVPGMWVDGAPPPSARRHDGGRDLFYRWGSWDVNAEPFAFIEYPEIPWLRHRKYLDRAFMVHSESGADNGTTYYWFQDITSEFELRKQELMGRRGGDALIQAILNARKRDSAYFPGVHHEIAQLEDVGGDFFFARTLDPSTKLLLVGDSAGKSVRGAMISLVAGSIMQEMSLDISGRLKTGGNGNGTGPNDSTRIIETELGDAPAQKILEDLHNRFSERLELKGNLPVFRRRDIGLDCVVALFDLAAGRVSVAQGNLPMWRVRNGEITPLCQLQEQDGKSVGSVSAGTFDHQTFDLEEGDLFFTATDGVYDQPGRGHPAQDYEVKTYGKDSFTQFLQDQAQRIDGIQAAQERWDAAKSVLTDAWADLELFRGSSADNEAPRIDDTLMVVCDPYNL